MKYVVNILPAFLAAALLIFGISLSLFVPRLQEVSQPVMEKEVWVYAGHPVSQTVAPINNGLSMVRIYMRNVALRNQDPLEFTVTEISSSRVIRSILINGFNIGDGEMVRLQFEPIDDSAGKTYSLGFSSPTQQVGQAIGIGYVSSDQYPSGSAETGEASPGDLSFDLYYRPSDRGNAVSSTIQHFRSEILSVQTGLVFCLSLFFLLVLFRLVSPWSRFSPQRTPAGR